MPRFSAFALAAALAGCAGVAGAGSPIAACTDAEYAAAVRTADLDTPPAPVGGLAAVQDRVRVPREGSRVASPSGRFAIVRAVIDPSGTVRCTDVLDAASGSKADAARRAVHRSPFTAGRRAGEPVVSELTLRLDVQGQGVRTIVRGDAIRG